VDDGGHVIDEIHYRRYLAFFYCNITAFAASLVVIVLVLILHVQHDREKEKKDDVWITSQSHVVLLPAVMVLDLFSLMGAYAAGTCQDKISTVYSAVLIASAFLYIVVIKLMDWWFPYNTFNSSSSPGATMPTANTSPGSGSGAMTSLIGVPDSDSGSVPKIEDKEALKKLKAEARLRKVLMLLAAFVMSITYVAGMRTPGGLWESTSGSHRLGDAILKDHHNLRLTVFQLCNTTAFVASLFILILLILDSKKLREKMARSLKLALYVCIVVALVGLGVAYAAGSCRQTGTTFIVVSLVGAVLAFILLHVLSYTSCSSTEQQTAENKQNGDNARY
jgi:hypothetical protein